jgi:hypothetical protein
MATIPLAMCTKMSSQGENFVRQEQSRRHKEVAGRSECGNKSQEHIAVIKAMLNWRSMALAIIHRSV